MILAHTYLGKFPTKSIFNILRKGRTSLSFNSTACQHMCAHNCQAASSRDARLHHSTKPVAS